MILMWNKLLEETGTDHCWWERGSLLAGWGFVWVPPCRAAGLQTQRLLRDAWGSSGENDLWPPWLGNPRGHRGTGRRYGGLAVIDVGREGGLRGEGWRGNLRPQREAGVGELMRGSGLCPRVSGAGLDPMGARVGDMTVDQSHECPNQGQILLVEQGKKSKSCVIQK